LIKKRERAIEIVKEKIPNSGKKLTMKLELKEVS